MDQREPCPWRIVDDCGAAFSMGAIGGSIFHGFKGFRNAPKGFPKRISGATLNIKRNAAITGGNFAIWGGVFSVIDCSLAAYRQKEDPWNSILSGFFTGGILQIRQGLLPAATSAIVGGLILGVIEGVSLVISRVGGTMMLNENMAQQQQQQ